MSRARSFDARFSPPFPGLALSCPISLELENPTFTRTFKNERDCARTSGIGCGKSCRVLSGKVVVQCRFPEYPVFALVRRGAVSIGLQLASQRRPAGTGSCYIWVDDVREIYNELSAREVEFADDIAFRDEYEMTDFVIHDPDGNHIGIGGD